MRDVGDPVSGNHKDQGQQPQENKEHQAGQAPMVADLPEPELGPALYAVVDKVEEFTKIADKAQAHQSSEQQGGGEGQPGPHQPEQLHPDCGQDKRKRRNANDLEDGYTVEGVLLYGN